MSTRKFGNKHHAKAKHLTMSLASERRGIQFKLSVYDVYEILNGIGDVCPCCKFLFDTSKPNSNKYPSFDRISSDRGYVRDNIVVLCRKCNTLKGALENGDEKRFKPATMRVAGWMSYSEIPIHYLCLERMKELSIKLSS